MPPAARNHKIRRVIASCYETPWAITPAKLAELADFLDARAAGHLSDADIETRLAESQIVGGLSFADDDEVDPERPYTVRDGVAVLRLYGTLMPRANLMSRFSGGTSYQQFSEAITQAAADPDVNAIVLDVDSAGGSVLGCEECAAAVAAAAQKKITVSVASGQCCSAAYWIASAASELIASPSSQVGSIGVYSLHTDRSAAETTAGVRRTLIQAGTEKTRGNPYETLDQAGREAMLRTVRDYYTSFVAAVAANRQTTVAAVEQRFGQGESMKADRALSAGLVDRLATLAAIVDELAAEGAPPSTKPIQPPTFPAQGVLSMDPKKVAALQALSLVGENPTQAEYDAALAKMAAMQAAASPVQAAAAPPPAAPPQAAAAAAPPPAASVPGPAPAADQLAAARLAERDRIQQIEARGALLNVDAATIRAAIDAGTSMHDFLDQATNQAVRNEPGVQRLAAGEAQADRFGTAAAMILANRMGARSAQTLPEAAASLRHMSLFDVARESLRLRGDRLLGDPDDIAQRALQGSACTISASGYQSLNSPGDFPNILSAAANIMLSAGEPYANTTFQNWAYRMPSVPDFRPQTIIRIGEFGEMPLHVDGDVFEQSTFEEGYAWIQTDSYGDEFALTPRMIVDDNLGAFLEALTDKPAAHAATLNRLCVNLLVNNVVCADGTALYDASRGNVRAAGGAPSQTELSEIRKLFRAQQGLSAKRKLNYTVNRILVPFALETTTEALLAALQVVPASTTDVETFRRKVDYDIEPLLDDASSAVWYAFATPGRAIAYTHQRGFESMKVRIYTDPRTNCRVHQFEGRFAAAVRNPQGTARNIGAGA